jgi:type VI secretion system protein ImpA
MESAPDGSPSRTRPVSSREDAYRQLAAAANVLRQLEPHSPIPYLIQRAVELGRLPFPQLIRELVRDANVIAELDRELGIKETTPQEAAG